MILSLKEICKSYDSREVLRSVSMDCDRGEICGLIGPNGAGKTTLFRIILGLIKPDSGSREINSSASKPIGGIIEEPALYGYLSAFENIKVFAGLQGLSIDQEKFESMMQQVSLTSDRTDPVENYSTGMKQRLGLAIAMINQPECIILDEPFSGLDPMGIRSIQKLIRQLAKQERIGVLISSHKLSDLGFLCDRLYVINEGRITRSGAAGKLLEYATRYYQLIGKSLDNSQALKEITAEIGEGSALVSPGTLGIESLLQQLAEEGTQISACIPQTNLEALFDNR